MILTVQLTVYVYYVIMNIFQSSAFISPSVRLLHSVYEELTIVRSPDPLSRCGIRVLIFTMNESSNIIGLILHGAAKHFISTNIQKQLFFLQDLFVLC